MMDRVRAQAVFFSVIMVLSMVAIGGTAAASTVAPADAIEEPVEQFDTPDVETTSPTTPSADTTDISEDEIDDANTTVDRVTLVTGETVVVVDDGDEVNYHISDAEGHYAQYGDDAGMYVVPEDINLDVYDEELFNVTRLVDEGLTDDEVNGVPVIVEHADVATAADADSEPTFDLDQTFDSIGASAGTLHAEEAGSNVAAQSASIERVYLDRQVEAEMDVLPGEIGAEVARQTNDIDGSNVNVSIIDSGIDDEHPDFGDRIIIEKNYVDGGDETDDPRGHGTHVAGIAAGDGTEGDGQYVGVAPGANIFDKRALDDEGTGTLSDIVTAVEDSVDNEADIISMSLGAPIEPDNPLNDAVAAAHDDGVVVVSSAGNSGPGAGTISAPANAPESISVGASDPTDRFYDDDIAAFSSRGPTELGDIKPDVVAPGVFVVAAGSEDAGEFPYTEKSGTSMSAPMVTGTIALMLEERDDLSPEEVRSALATTAHQFDEPSVYDQGAGQIDAQQAVNATLFVEEPTLGFGELEFEDSATEEFTIENQGDETMNLSLSGELTGPDGEAGSFDLTPESTTLEPGETTTVELSVHADVESPGLFSGTISYEETTTDETFHSVFGYEQEPDLSDAIVVEKVPMDDRDIEGEQVRVESHDDREQSESYEFDSDGQAVFFPETDANMTIWTDGREEATSDPIMMPTVIDPEEYQGETLVFDEHETVEYEFDTSEIEDEHGDLYNRRVSATFNLDVQPDSFFGSYSRSLTTIGIGLDHTGTAYFGETPEWATEPEEQTYASLQRITVPQDTHDPWETGGIQNPHVYDLLTFTEGIDGPVTDEVDHDTLQELDSTYQRDDVESASELQLSHTFEPDRDWTGPVSTTFLQELGEQVDQTYYTSTGDLRSNFGVTTEYETAGETIEWDQDATDHVPEAGYSDRFVFNQHPAVNYVDDEFGTLVNPSNIYQDGFFLADQPTEEDTERHPYELGFSADTSYEVRYNGDILEAEDGVGDDYTIFISGDDMPDIEDGDVVEIDLEATELAPVHELDTEYGVEYHAGNENEPPEIVDVAVEGLDAYNERADGTVEIHVEIEDHVTGVPDAFEAYYASADAENTAFEDADGWNAANIEHVSDGTYALEADVAAMGDEEGLSLALRAVDEEGSYVETTLFDVANFVEAPAVINQSAPDRVDSGDEITATVDVTELERVQTSLHDASTVSEDDLTLFHGSTINAFDQWRAFDEPQTVDDWPITVETADDTVGSVVLEHTFRDDHGDEVTVITGPTAVYDEPLVVGDSDDATVDTIQEAVDLAPEDTTIYVEDGTYEESVHITTNGLSLTPIDEDADVTVEAPDDADTALLVDGAHDTHVDGVSIHANGGDGLVATDDAVDATVDAPTVTGVTVEDADTAVGFHDAAAAHVEEVTVTDSTTGVAVHGGEDAHLEGVHAEDTHTGVALDGVTDAATTDLSVMGATDGVVADDAGTVNATDVHVDGTEAGVLAAGETHLTLTDATVMNATDAAVQTVGAHAGVHVSDFHAEAVGIGVHAADTAHATVTDSTVVDADHGLRLDGGATADATLIEVSADIGVYADGADATATEIHHNDFAGSEQVAWVDTEDELDLRLNYVGDRAGGETIVEGTTTYDPFLTSAPEAVDFERTDIGTDLHLEAGDTYTVGVPGPTTQSVEEAFGAFDGAIYAFEDGEWELVTDGDLDALDAFAVVPEEDVRVTMTFEAEDGIPPGPGATDLEEGWNFVASPTYDGVETAFGQSTADIGLAMGLLERPHGQLGPAGELDGPHVFGSTEDPHVSAFEGTFVFVEDEGQQPALLTSDVTVEALYDQLGLEYEGHDDDGDSEYDSLATPPAIVN